LVPKDRWFHIEVFMKVGHSDGVLTVWLDGVQVWSGTALNTLGQPSNNYLVFGVGNYSTAMVGKYIYIDDVRVTDHRMGP
jgi:hypothetical protein